MRLLNVAVADDRDGPWQARRSELFLELARQFGASVSGRWPFFFPGLVPIEGAVRTRRLLLEREPPLAAYGQPSSLGGSADLRRLDHRESGGCGLISTTTPRPENEKR
jgi:hypothetical protein